MLKEPMRHRPAAGSAALSLSITDRKWKIRVFYTQLSDLAATVSALLLVILGQPAWVTTLRYLSTCIVSARLGRPKTALLD